MVRKISQDKLDKIKNDPSSKVTQSLRRTKPEQAKEDKIIHVIAKASQDTAEVVKILAQTQKVSSERIERLINTMTEKLSAKPANYRLSFARDKDKLLTHIDVKPVKVVM